MTATLTTRPTLPRREAKATAVKALAEGGEQKLDALTSLRFFAALMIFIGHATALTPPNRPNFTEGLALWQGVSFFFVLSGFILAYVYPRIDTVADAGKFLLARFARIWPTHLLAFCVTLVLVPQCLHIPNAVTAAVMNLCLLQVWTLDPAMAASFNKVSWTISVELFFYVCFPFLIKDFNKPFKTRWIVTSALSLSFILLCLIPFFPGCAGYVFPEPVFVGFNPLCRLIEFIFGISICRVFTQNKLKTETKPTTAAYATCLEVLAIACAAGAVCLPSIWPVDNSRDAFYVIRSCVLDIGGAPAYGALILLMASGQGYISKLLTNKLFVGLGEISFSLYMFHLSVIFFLVKYQPSFANQSDWLLPVTAFIVCLCLSHLNFTFVETPCRRAIMSRVKKQPITATATTNFATTNFATATKAPKVSKLSMISFAEICFVCLALACFHTQFRFIPQALAARVESHSVPNLRGVEFGARFKLRALKLTRQAGGLQVNAIWQSLIPQKLTYINALHLLNAQGKTVSANDYLQDSFQRRANAGQIWEDKIYLNRSQLIGVSKLGLSLYQPPSLQPLVTNDRNSGARTDWDGRRLLISIE